MHETPRRVGLTAAVVTFAMLAIVINLQEHGWVAWTKLVLSGTQIPATIISRNPERHDGCNFEYTVDSHRYSGHQQGCSMNVGDNAQAIYLPDDPGFASLRPPMLELLFRVGVPVVLAVIAGWVTAWRVPREAPRI